VSSAFDFGRLRAFAPFAFLAVPVVGVVELGTEIVQERGAAPIEDFAGAKAIVQRDLKADDLIIFAPSWDDPVGRETFGDELITLERAAFPDVSRFPRAYEVAIRGAERPELKGWKTVREEKSGKVTVRLRENPAPVHVLTDLVSIFGSNVHVSKVDAREGSEPHEKSCEWMRGGASAGGLGAGPATPQEHFGCPNGIVGVSVLETLDYTSHRVILATPGSGSDGSGTLLRFSNVHFGQKIHGHHGLYVEQERGRTGPPVSIIFRHDGKILGRGLHLDGDGWSGFEIDTSALAGQTGDLEVLLNSSDGGRRYGFEADTR
jgi:hypothetical protein